MWVLQLIHEVPRRTHRHRKLHLRVATLVDPPVPLTLLLSHLDHNLQNLLQVISILLRSFLLNVLSDHGDVPLANHERYSDQQLDAVEELGVAEVAGGVLEVLEEKVEGI